MRRVHVIIVIFSRASWISYLHDNNDTKCVNRGHGHPSTFAIHKEQKNTGQGPPAIPVCPTTYNFSWAAEVQFIIQNIFFF